MASHSITPHGIVSQTVIQSLTSKMKSLPLDSMDKGVSGAEGEKPTTFPLFGDLPVELQLAIWSLAFPPQLLHISRTWLRDFARASRRVPKDVPEYYICRKSAIMKRQQVYHISMDLELPSNPMLFNTARDVLVFDNCDTLSSFLRDFPGHVHGTSLRRLSVKILAIQMNSTFMPGHNDVFEEQCPLGPHDKPGWPICGTLRGAKGDVCTLQNPWSWKLLRDFRTIEELVFVRPQNCTHGGQAVEMIRIWLGKQYALWDTIWKVAKREPLYKLPTITYMTLPQLEEKILRCAPVLEL